MYGHQCRHNTTIAKTTAPRAVDKYVLHLSYHSVKHSFMAVLVHFLYFIPPKWEKKWLHSYAVGAQNGAFLLLRIPKLRVAAPPHTPWLGTTPPLRLAMQQRG